MGQKPNWKKEECDYLEEAWGEVSIPKIAKRLDRSISAVTQKANRIGLKRYIHSGEYITYNQLMTALRGRNSSSYAKISWIQNRGLPIKYKKSINKNMRVIYLKDFWKWAYQNRTFINFSKVEPLILGEEPDWVKGQRKADTMYAAYKKTPWTPQEDELLKDCLKMYKYSYRDISIRLKRTEGAIKRRVFNLGLKCRPLRADPYNPWTEADKIKLYDLYNKGYKPEVMAEFINRSALAIRGKIEREILYKKEIS